MRFSETKWFSMRIGVTVALAAIAFALITGCGNSGGGGGTTGGTPTGSAPATSTAPGTLNIEVIPKGTSHEYWKSIHAGANQAANDLKSQGINVNIIWQGPLNEDDRNGQIEVVDGAITKKVDGIVLAPLDSTALVQPVNDAADHKIPVVIIDSSVNTPKIVSFVATDNEKGGMLAGQELSREIGGKGPILMLRYQEGSASTEAREKGFLEAIKQSPGITIVSDDQYAGATVNTAYKAAQNLINRYGHQVVGVFAPNESSARGMKLALRDAGLLGKIKFVGFDSSTDLDQGLQNKDINALVVQDPFKMGDEGVTTIVNSIKGKAVDKRVDTGVTLVTPDNMNQPAMQKLLHPPSA